MATPLRTDELNADRLNAWLQPSATPARLLHPPSREQRFWLRALPAIVSPEDGRGSLFARAVHVFSVAPFAHVTFFSLTYQAYLYDIFHTTKTARFFHQLCMPVCVFMILVALSPYGHASLVAAALLALWYGAQAAVERYWLWGALMTVLLAAMWAGAGVYLTHFGLPAAERTFFAPTPLAANPFLWMAVCSFLQALSHAPEPRLPPRVTATPRWQTVGEFVFGAKGARHGPGTMATRMLRVALQSVWGTLDEFWASPRLFPYGVLEQLWRHGYQKARFAELDRMTREALASGDPAIDYIGVGGGTFLQLPREEAERKVAA